MNDDDPEHDHEAFDQIAGSVGELIVLMSEALGVCRTCAVLHTLRDRIEDAAEKDGGQAGIDLLDEVGALLSDASDSVASNYHKLKYGRTN